MKNWTLLLASIFLLAAAAAGQPFPREYRSVSAASLDLGTRSVRIPVPDRFTDSMLHFPRVASRLMAAESPANEVLAVHVADEMVSVLKEGQERDLTFYTKVSVLRELKNAEIEPAEFLSLVSDFERLAPGALETVAKNAERGASQRLSDFWGSEAGLKVGETRMLGYFGKQRQAISSLFVMNAEIFDRKILILGSMSLIHVNKRVLFMYVFRVPTGRGDKELVSDLTNSWIAKTIAAN